MLYIVGWLTSSFLDIHKIDNEKFQNMEGWRMLWFYLWQNVKYLVSLHILEVLFNVHVRLVV